MHKHLIRIKARLCLCLSFLMIIPSFSNAAFAATTSTANLTNSGFETGDLTGWTKGTVADSASVISSDSFIFPYSGNYMLRLGTATTSKSTLQDIGSNEVYQDFVAQNSSLKFYYNVYTYDYTGYDQFRYTVINKDTNEVISNFTQPGWGQTGDTSLKTTGWQTVNLDISKYIGKNLRISFDCKGTRDLRYPSWAYIDFGDDNSTQGSIVTNFPNNVNSTAEGNTGIPLEVCLDKMPQSNVTINVQGDSLVKVNSTQLVFTPGNWNVKQSIVTTAVDDSIYEGPHFGKVSFSATSSDSNFNGISTASNVYIDDNDSDVSGKYTISTQISSGKGTISPQVQQVSKGGSASVSIVPDTAYAAFVQDNGVNVSDKVISNTYKITNIAEHHNISVNFVPVTPPKVIYTKPLNGATNVYKNANISIKFSEGVQAGDDYANIKLLDSSSKIVATNNTLNGDVLTLTPTSNLNGNSQYKVSIPKLAVKDMYSKTLVSTYEFTFTTNDLLPVVNSVTVNPSSVNLVAGKQQQLTVTASMSDGNTNDVTNGSTGTTYTSSNTAVATVDANGLIIASSSAAVGTKTTITATNNAKTATCAVTIITDPITTVSSLSVSPTAAMKAMGQQQQLAVTAKMGDVTSKDVTNGSTGTVYTSSDTSVSTVDANGLITVSPSASEGAKATITAAYGGKTGTCVITVAADPSKTVSTLSVSPSSASVVVGKQQQLKATATMGDATTKDVTNGSSGTIYGSSDTTVATVDANGLVTVSSIATVGAKATITVSNGGKIATSTITVAADPATLISSLSVTPTTISKKKGEQQQLQVIATMKDGSTKDVTSGNNGTTYTSSDLSTSTVDANGLVAVTSSATVAHQATITVKYGGKTVTSLVTVVGEPYETVASLVVNPTAENIIAGQQQQLQATATMGDGSTKDVTSGSAGTVYTSSATSVATVDANGMVTVTAVAAIGAKATITVSIGGKTTTSVVTVVGDPAKTVASLTVTPSAQDVILGQQQQLKVIATMGDGSTKDVTDGSNGITYTSSDTLVATVDANGLVTVASAVATRSTSIITASYGGKTAKCIITAIEDPLKAIASISVDPSTISKIAGQQQQLKVTATMGDKSTKDVTNPSEGTLYTSSDTSVATVDANGLVTVMSDVATGATATITITCDGQKATSMVTVAANPAKTVSSLSVDPATISKIAGQQQQLKVTATMGDASTKDVTNASEGTVYTSSDTSIATVDVNGLVTVASTATVGAKATITASNGGKTIVSTVTVAVDPAKTVSSLSVDPSIASKIAGQQQQLKVTATMGDGSIKDVTNGSEGTVYTSNITSVATVDANGLVTITSTAAVGTKVTITASNGGKTITSVITVILDPSKIVASLSADPSTISKIAGDQQQLKVTATMGDGSTKDVTNGSEGTVYESSNTVVATVDTNGLITVLPTATAGTKTVITVKNSGKILSCIVTVESGITLSSISIDTTAVTLGQVEQKQLAVTATMSDSSTKDITNGSEGTVYASSNTAVATVDANGLITVLPTATAGTKTVITVKNSGKTLSCIVTVESVATITISSISIDTTTVTLGQGEQKQLVVTATMSDNSTKDITNGSEGTVYESSNTAIATVDANGLITVLPTATSGAKTVITVKNSGKTLSCIVTVASGITLSSISIDTTAATLAQGEQKQLVVTATMSDSSTKDITNGSEGTVYASSNTTVATVDANGLITVLPTAAAGTKTVISVKNSARTLSCTVTVGSGSTISSISVDTTAVTLGQGQQKQLVVTATMSDSSTKDITNGSEGTVYASSNTAVATVDANGLITVLPTATAGTKTVISIKNSARTLSCTVTVGSGATISSISVDTTAVTLVQAEQKQLVVTATMSDGSTKDITNGSEGTVYASSNTAVATVDTNGLITVLPTATAGTKTVISVKNSARTLSCTVTVGSGLTISSISIDTTAVTLIQGQQKQLTVIATMSDGSTKDITNGSEGTVYESSNTAVATVDANGLITVLPTATTGTKTVITAKNSARTLSCTVTVANGATISSISIDTTTATIAQGQQKQLTVTATMLDGSTKDITNGSEGTVYASSNTAVATVDANGLITVLPTATTGTKTVITAKNSARTLSCTITVGGGIALSSISVNPATVSVVQGQQKQLSVAATMSDGSTKDITNGSEGTVYTSSNTAVATVDANGLITVLPTATTGTKSVISVKNNGKTVSCTVTAGSGITLSSISVNPTTATITQGQQKQLVVTATMSDSSTKDITNGSEGTVYASSNTAVATVDANGLITVLPTATAGTKTVISIKNSARTLSCTVTVGIGATISSISIDTTTVTLAQGQQKQLSVTATMSDGSTKDITNGSEGTVYASSNTAVATVGASGLITVLPTATTGTKTVVTAKNSARTLSCTVTVG